MGFVDGIHKNRNTFRVQVVPIRVEPQVFVDILAPWPPWLISKAATRCLVLRSGETASVQPGGKVFLRYLRFRCNPRRPLPQLEQRGLSRCGMQKYLPRQVHLKTCTASLPSTICLQLPWSGLPRYFGRPSLWKGLTRRSILLTEIAKGNI